MRPAPPTVAADPGAAPRLATYLHAGQLTAPSAPTAITTILGSCVAVCLWDATRRQGGMNHYLLPYWSGSEASSPRFGNVAVEGLLSALRRLGSASGDLQAKVFGGACVVPALMARGDHLGAKNVVLARKLLAERGIPVVAEDVLGQRGRRVVFHTDDGAAFVRFV